MNKQNIKKDVYLASILPLPKLVMIRFREPVRVEVVLFYVNNIASDHPAPQ